MSAEVAKGVGARDAPMYEPRYQEIATFMRAPYRLDHVHVHVPVTSSVEVVEADYVRKVDHHRYVAVPGGRSPALSDHAALVSTLRIRSIDD